ncbi:MAG: hypothetical protein JOY80_02110 [Candidatus Dormibacteraeota bacterium]|nr:hypothetical protein [Candidatus Dormibacteraeota bacterium]
MPDWRPTALAGDEPSPATASPLVHAAERLTSRIASLVNEVSALRSENAALRREVREAVAMLERAASSAPEPSRRGRKPRAAGGQQRRRARVAKGRATPDSVTGEVVRAVLAKLGSATASEIAVEITKAGAPVSGRAVRFLAERAGAQTFVGEDGQRRYRL